MPLGAVCSHAQWDQIYERLVQAIQTHRSTLIFVNTRRLAERIAHRLREVLGEEAVAGHHGSLSKEIRWQAEQRLKAGSLKAIVATASLEMGIDVGAIDLVCQIGSPRSIATFLQRIGRSGHSLQAIPKGRIFPLTRDELLEAMALVRAVRNGRLDTIEMPVAPLDILAQQIVAAVSVEEWDERQLLQLIRRAWPYRDLSAENYESILQLLAEGLTPTTRRGAWLHRDRIHGQLRSRAGARLAALTSGGAIPEAAEYRVVALPDEIFIGKLDEHFAVDSSVGDVFLLGNSSWRVRSVRAGEVLVEDAEGAPPNVPFWFGESPGRTRELSEEVSQLREEIARRSIASSSAHGASQLPAQLAADPLSLSSQSVPRITLADASPASSLLTPGIRDRQVTRELPLSQWLHEQCGVRDSGAYQAVEYIQAQVAALELVPTRQRIVFERFFDESGGMQLVIHAPLGARINRAWGLALRKRFCRSFDFELQAAATDNGIVLSIGPQHSFPIDALFQMLGPHNARYLLEQAVLAAPMFQVRWRWNVTRSLAVLRTQNGQKVPPHLQRFRSDDLLASAFPETVGCLENHHGDVEIPDHPLVRQTMHDCLTEAMDLPHWIEVLEQVRAGQIELLARDTREPSPFCYELLNAAPYAFLDDAPLEERRTRAVSTRRAVRAEEFRDLARLDDDAIAQVRREAWPIVRNADELHDALLALVWVDEREAQEWSPFLETLKQQRRAATMLLDSGNRFWFAAENWPVVRTLFPAAIAEPAIQLPAHLDYACERTDALVAVARGRLQHSGPLTVELLAATLALDAQPLAAALEVLEARGLVLRGRFTAAANAAPRRPPTSQTSATIRSAALGGSPNDNNAGLAMTTSALNSTGADESAVEWCDRRLLARIHRLTMEGLRRRIQPVPPAAYMAFLLRHQRVEGSAKWTGQAGLHAAILQLQGYELPAVAWERSILPARLPSYDPQWLDQLFLRGEVTWGRLRVPTQVDEARTPAGKASDADQLALLAKMDGLTQSNQLTAAQRATEWGAEGIGAGECGARECEVKEIGARECEVEGIGAREYGAREYEVDEIAAGDCEAAGLLEGGLIVRDVEASNTAEAIATKEVFNRVPSHSLSVSMSDVHDVTRQTIVRQVTGTTSRMPEDKEARVKREPRRGRLMTRNVPLALVLRRDLAWLLDRRADREVTQLSQEAQQILLALRSHGALFWQDLAEITRLAPRELDGALRELAGWGQITSDAFAGVRNLVTERPHRSRYPSPQRGPSSSYAPHRPHADDELWTVHRLQSELSSPPQADLSSLPKQAASKLNEVRHQRCDDDVFNYGRNAESTRFSERDAAAAADHRFRSLHTESSSCGSAAMAAETSGLQRSSWSASAQQTGPTMPASLASSAGRWARFPGYLSASASGAYLENWCRQLLHRYGVVMRDLLARETAAPPWRELVVEYRRMELRGEVCGGRFITDVAGEQFAEPATVAQLRAVRDTAPVDSWCVLSAADPLNLSGLIDRGPRIPATHRNRLIYRGGRCIAARVGGEIQFFIDNLSDFPLELIAQWRAALEAGASESPLMQTGGNSPSTVSPLPSPSHSHTVAMGVVSNTEDGRPIDLMTADSRNSPNMQSAGSAVVPQLGLLAGSPSPAGSAGATVNSIAASPTGTADGESPDSSNTRASAQQRRAAIRNSWLNSTPPRGS